MQTGVLKKENERKDEINGTAKDTKSNREQKKCLITRWIGQYQISFDLVILRLDKQMLPYRPKLWYKAWC